MDDRTKYRFVRLLQRAPITYVVRNQVFALLKRWMCFDVVKQFPDGLRLCVDLTDYIGFRIWERGAWEKRILVLVRELLQDGGVFVEVGMHCGLFATSIAHCLGNKVRVIGFEPNERVARLARKTVELNSLTNLALDSRAISNITAQVTLYVEPEGNSGQTGFIKRLGARRAVSVQAVTLTEALDEYRVDRVSVLKLDVEGAEALILPAIEPLLEAGRVTALLVEMHEVAETGFGASLTALYRLILRSGMVAFHYSPNGELTELEPHLATPSALKGHLLALRHDVPVPRRR